MPVIQPTDWYYPPDKPLASRVGLYDVVEAHPLTPKEEDVIVRAYWGPKFGTLGFWYLSQKHDEYVWSQIVNVLRWRGRKPTPRVLLITPAAPHRVRLMEQLSLDLPKRRVALLV